MMVDEYIIMQVGVALMRILLNFPTLYMLKMLELSILGSPVRFSAIPT